MRHGLFQSPPRFHSTSPRPATPIDFVPKLSHTTARQSREVGCREVQSPRPCVPFGRTLRLSVSARPAQPPCDTRLCVAAGCGSIGRIENPNGSPKSAARRHARPMRAGRCRPTAQCVRSAPGQTTASCHPSRPPRLRPAPPTDGQTVQVSSVENFEVSPPRMLLFAEHQSPPPSAHRTAVQHGLPCRRRPVRVTPWFCRCRPDRAGR